MVIQPSKLSKEKYWKESYNALVRGASNGWPLSTHLGVWLGPVNLGSSACADDEYLMSDSQTKLQALLDIASFYGSIYRVTYGAAKTKVTVEGSNVDMNYYSDTTPWQLDNTKVKVTEDNDHLGQIVSGVNQEQKNVDLRFSKGRNNIFGLLGPVFSFKCILSPLVKIHLFRTCTCPILRSGLSSFSQELFNHFQFITEKQCRALST